MGDEPKLSYLVINHRRFESFVRDLLLIKQHGVEVYVKPNDSKKDDWSLEYQGSPGNITQFEELLFENCEIPYTTGVMAINIHKNTLFAAAYVNVSEAEMLVTEFADNELFTELEGLIAQVCPKECLIPNGKSAELITLNSVLERNGIYANKVKNSDFNSSDVEQDLNRLIYFYEEQQRNAMALPETNLKEALCCLQVVIKYLNLIADEQCYNHFKLSAFDFRRFVRVDNTAFLALNVFPKSNTTFYDDSGKYHSLFGVLDKCCTQQGRRLLKQWLRQPLRDIHLITERLEIVEALARNTEARHVLYSNTLTRVPDMLMFTKKLKSKKATLQDCYRIYQTVYSARHIITVLRKCGNKYVESMLIIPMCDLLMDCEKYLELIEHTLDLDLVDRREFLIKPNNSKKLQALADSKFKLEEKMQKVLKEAADDLELEAGKRLKLESNEQNMYYFRVTLRDECALWKKKKKYKIEKSYRSGVRFTTDKLTELSESYSELMNNYQNEQKQVVKEVFEIAAGYVNTFRNLNMYIAKVDVLVSFANVAANAPIPFVKPKMLDEGSGILKLKKTRHPCIEVQNNITFIPNDVEFKKDEKHFYVITGPNMGGKSTFIRSIAVCVLLAHIGSMVPCAEAEISVVDAILVRIGGNDNQARGLSTFMVEMVETATIIKAATSNSLVIIDELGRGTSTYDGCGIAWVIAEHLTVKTKCFSLFATHFQEITELPERHDIIRNLHVTAVTTENTITPLYQIRGGPCDKSYGIHCAQMVGFPSDVLEMAMQYQRELENFQAMHYITNFEISLKRKIIQEGDAIIAEFLKKCRDIDINNLSEAEIFNQLDKLKDQLPKDNLFINGFLNGRD